MRGGAGRAGTVPLARLDRRDLHQRVGNEPGQRNHDEARRRENIDPAIYRTGARRPRQLVRARVLVDIWLG